MKFKFLILGIGILMLNACVSKSDYEKLEKEKNDLANKLEELYEEKRLAEIEKNKKPYVSESQALEYIKDNYTFYQKDMLYRNVQLRRISDNSFKVSIEECTKKGQFSNDDFFWFSNIRTLTVYSDGTYDF